LERPTSLCKNEFERTDVLQDLQIALEAAIEAGGRKEREWEKSSEGSAKIKSLTDCSGPLGCGSSLS